MSVQCQVVQKQTTPNHLQLLARIEFALNLCAKLYTEWCYQRQIKRSRLMLEALPEHIRHDLGWPNVDDRLPPLVKKHYS